MPNRFSRRSVLAAGAGTFASIGFVRSRASAAQFNYKCGHNLAVDSAMNVRSVELWKKVEEDTGGRLSVRVFANSALGSDTAVAQQVRSGATEMCCFPSGSAQSLVPEIGITGVGFAFQTDAVAIKAMDGALGDALRTAMEQRGMTVIAKETFELGLRQLTNSIKPIVTASDLAGMKIRTPPAKLSVDLFRTLGATPAPIDFAEAYTALQTHLVDGTELPVSTITTGKYYEVQKYLSIANHTWAGYWLIINPQAWAALPPDIQAIVKKRAPEYINLQRHDIAILEPVMIDKLHRLGMQVNQCDTTTFRAKLGPYYARWKAEFGPQLWSLLEMYSGKLG